MTFHILLISSLLSAYLPAAGSATVSDAAFSWTNVGGKNFLPPFENHVASLSALEETRCWEHGVNAAIEGAMAAQLNEPGYHINLSEQYTYQCGYYAGEKCNDSPIAGQLFKNICSRITTGLTDEQCVSLAPTPANNIAPECSTNNCAQIAQRQLKAANCDLQGSHTKETLKKALLEHGPLAITMTFFNSMGNYTSGLYEPEAEEASIGVYTVTLVGWETDDKGRLLFIIRNILGEKWGMKGYMKVLADTVNLASGSPLEIGHNVLYFDFNKADLPGYPCISEEAINLGDVSIYGASASKTITVRNCGGRAVRWSAQTKSPVLMNPLDGTLNVGEEQVVTISINNDAASDGKLNNQIIVNSEMGHSTAINVTAKIIKPTEPVVDFTATPTAGYAPLKVAFTNTTKGGEITGYKWKFGDTGAISSEENPTHEYIAPGDYTVTLTVTWGGGEIIKEKKGYIAVYKPKGEPAESTTKEVKSGCNATSHADTAFLLLFAFFLIFFPKKRLN